MPDSTALSAPASVIAAPDEQALRRAIWAENHRLAKERREEVARVMAEYDKNVYQPARRAMQARCAALGHNWVYAHLGPLGDPWFDCHTCGASECRVGPRTADIDEDKDA